MDVLMKLPPETKIHPGHTDPTTIGDEWEQNAFVRLWRGLDEEGTENCTVGGEDATLVLWAPTTTAATRPGSAGSPARTTSCRAADRGGGEGAPPGRGEKTRGGGGREPTAISAGRGPLAGPDCAYSAAARRSCSASGAFAGSPSPPTADQVSKVNWYLPWNWPPPPTAEGSPPDSHWAIACSAGETATGGRGGLADLGAFEAPGGRVPLLLAGGGRLGIRSGILAGVRPGRREGRAAARRGGRGDREHCNE